MNAVILEKTKYIYYPAKNSVLNITNEIIQIPAAKYPYIYKENTNETENILGYIDRLKHINMDIEVKKKVNKYENKMKKLLKIYDNGNGKEKFKQKEMKLYFMLQDEFSDIIDLRYDISNNEIKTNNKNIIVNVLDKIIEQQRSMIEDINNVIV